MQHYAEGLARRSRDPYKLGFKYLQVVGIRWMSFADGNCLASYVAAQYFAPEGPAENSRGRVPQRGTLPPV